MQPLGGLKFWEISPAKWTLFMFYKGSDTRTKYFWYLQLPVKKWGSPNMSPNLAHSASHHAPCPELHTNQRLFAKEGQGLGNVLRRTVLLHHNSCTSGRLKGSIVYLQWAPVKQESSNLRPLLEASMPARQFVRTLGTFKDFFFGDLFFAESSVTWGVFSKIFGEFTMKIGKMIISSHLPSCLHFLDKFQFQTKPHNLGPPKIDWMKLAKR